MCPHKGRGIMFGGVHDVEESEEGIDSEFFDTLFAWNVDRNRFFQLTLRRPKTGQKKAAPERNRRDRGKQAEEDLLRNLRELELKGTITAEGSEEGPAPPPEEEDVPEKPEKPVVFEMPHPRFNAPVTVQDDVLYIFGGTWEQGDQEWTFDELWAIDLNKLDGVKEIFRRELQDWKVEEEESDEDDDEEDSDEDSDEEDEEMGDSKSVTTEVTLVDSEAPTVIGDETETEEQSKESDGLPYPRPFEALRDFFARTRIEWQQVVIDKLNRTDGAVGLTPKEISTEAFDLAESKWWDCREEIRVLEDEQAEAGIGEVVSIENKSTAGVGRRR